VRISELERQIVELDEQQKRHASQVKQATDRAQSEHKIMSDAIKK